MTEFSSGDLVLIVTNSGSQPRAAAADQGVVQVAARPLRHLVHDGERRAERPCALRASADRARVDAAGLGVLDRLVEVPDHDAIGKARIGEDHRLHLVVDERRLRAIGGGGDDLPARLGLGSDQVRQRQRRAQRRLPGLPRQADQRRAFEAMAVAVDRVERLDDLALPRAQLEPATGVHSGGDLQPFDEPAHPFGTGQRGFARRSPAFPRLDRLGSWTSQSHRKKIPKLTSDRGRAAVVSRAGWRD